MAEGVDELETDPRKRQWIVQEIVAQFCQHWMKEVVPELSHRKKRQDTLPDLKVDGVILVVLPSSPKEEWPLGRVVEIYCEA